MLNVTFYGVRGSTPCPCEENQRYGGNTSCVALEAPGSDPVLLDMGTGLRFWGETQPHDGTFVAHALVTHLHFDHVQGLPFLAPADRVGARLDVYAPPQDGESLADAFAGFIRPPYFPVRWSELRGEYRFFEVASTELVVGDAKVWVRDVPHVGRTNGYRVELGGATVAYVSDHQMPAEPSASPIAEGVLALADGVDLLIHDAQYTAEEFAEKAHWGHCTVEYAVEVAVAAGARRVALFHHDPAHDDDTIDRLLDAAVAAVPSDVHLEVLAAAEGLTVTLADPLPDPFQPGATVG